MTLRSFLIDTKRHPEVLFFRSMASEGNLIPPAPFNQELPFEGYFSSEYHRIKSARERWESLSEDKKAEIRERIRHAKI